MKEIRVSGWMNRNRRFLISSVRFGKDFIPQSRVTKSLFPAHQLLQVAHAENYKRLVFIGPFPQLRIVSLFVHE